MDKVITDYYATMGKDSFLSYLVTFESAQHALKMVRRGQESKLTSVEIHAARRLEAATK